ncbi:MAG: hypothetical protein MI741_07380 [Rhodospirillales bacterium]|nr:hypothetical protein [Rhodospirillales bacterium]
MKQIHRRENMDAATCPTSVTRDPNRRLRLWIEFAALFVITPVLMAALEQSSLMWTVMAVLFVLARAAVLYRRVPEKLAT